MIQLNIMSAILLVLLFVHVLITHYSRAIVLFI